MEYLLPELVDHLIKNESAEVDVLETKDTWFGVTYQEDKETVMRAFKNRYRKRVYILRDFINKLSRYLQLSQETCLI